MFTTRLNSSAFFSMPRPQLVPTTDDERFTFFAAAIRRKDLQEINFYLEKFVYLIRDDDKLGNTLLHIALKDGNAQIVSAILKALNTFPDDYERLLSKPNAKGETPLHIAAQYGDVDSFCCLIDALDQQAYSAAKKISRANYLPLKLLKYNHRVDENDREEMRAVLEDFTGEGVPYKDLKMKEPFEKILAANKSLIDLHPDLARNLHLGYIAMSYARKILGGSSTHQTYNFLSTSEKEKLIIECAACVEEYTIENNLIEDKGGFPAQDDFNFALLDNVVKTLKKHQRGNCGEYAQLVYYALIKMGVKIPATIKQILSGDHAFVVLGEDDEAVVIDAWSGELYPACEVNKKLLNHYDYKKRDWNIVYPFNSDYQIIVPTKLNLSSEFFKYNTNMDLGEFELEEQEELLLHFQVFGDSVTPDEYIPVGSKRKR